MEESSKEQYWITYKWMIKDLHLKGLALQLFSIIYSFSRDNAGYFYGSHTYLADLLDTAKSAISSSLLKLEAQNLIISKITSKHGASLRKIYAVNIKEVEKIRIDGYQNDIRKNNVHGHEKDIRTDNKKISVRITKRYPYIYNKVNNNKIYNKVFLEKFFSKKENIHFTSTKGFTLSKENYKIEILEKEKNQNKLLEKNTKIQKNLDLEKEKKLIGPNIYSVDKNYIPRNKLSVADLVVEKMSSIDNEKAKANRDLKRQKREEKERNKEIAKVQKQKNLLMQKSRKYTEDLEILQKLEDYLDAWFESYYSLSGDKGYLLNSSSWEMKLSSQLFIEGKLKSDIISSINAAICGNEKGPYQRFFYTEEKQQTKGINNLSSNRKVTCEQASVEEKEWILKNMPSFG